MSSALAIDNSLFRRTADPDPDHGLVERAKQGDQQAFRRLFERHAPGVRRIVARYVKETDEVADQVQEVFARAFHALRRFDGRSRFFTWLYRIAVNQSIEGSARLRRQRQFEASMENVELHPTQVVDTRSWVATPDESLAAKQVARTVQLAVQALSPEYRTALQLREIEGLTYEEIAARLDIPLGTVRTRIFRAREAISSALVPVRSGRTSGRF